MADVKDGIKAALVATDAGAKAREAADLRASSATQAELFGADDDQAAGDARLPMPPRDPARNGPGRPAGARGRRTEAVATYLVSRFGDPLEGLMSMAMKPTGQLIDEVKAIAKAHGVKAGDVSVMEALRFQRGALEALLPYIHAKRAPEDGKGDVVTPVLNIGRFDQAPGMSKGLSAEDFIDVTPAKQNQGVSGDQDEGSHDDGSHDEG